MKQSLGLKILFCMGSHPKCALTPQSRRQIAASCNLRLTSNVRFLMHLLAHLEEWTESKSKIFNTEGYIVSVSPTLGDEKKARYVEFDGNGLLGRATLWEDGSLELEAMNEHTETVVKASRITHTFAALDDSLNWWLSEMAIYVSPET